MARRDRVVGCATKGLGVINKSGPAKHHNTTMKLLALLTVAVSLVLVGCSEKAPEPKTPAAPSTNAPAK